MAKRGRPPKDNKKDSQYRLRLSAEDLDMLEFSAEKMGVSKAEILRRGLESQYKIAKYFI